MSEFIPEVLKKKIELPDSYSPEKIKIDSKILEKWNGRLEVDIKISSMLPENGGTWSGEKGNSEWTPDDNVIPGDRRGTNPDGKTWKELKKEYGFDSIPFKDGEPDFSKIANGEVQIDNFSESRTKNFAQADIQLAKERGVSPQEIKKWRLENKYTWHEWKDCKTMQLVPTEVHGNIPHSGGIAETKSKNKAA